MALPLSSPENPAVWQLCSGPSDPHREQAARTRLHVSALTSTQKWLCPQIPGRSCRLEPEAAAEGFPALWPLTGVCAHSAR